MKCLISDDDVIITNILEIVVKSCGFTVDVVNEAFDLIQISILGNYDIIITDITMPGFDIIEFLVDVRANDVKSKIAVMSGGGFENAEVYLEKVQSIGANFVLRKPFSMDELRTILQEVKNENSLCR